MRNPLCIILAILSLALVACGGPEIPTDPDAAPMESDSGLVDPNCGLGHSSAVDYCAEQAEFLGRTGEYVDGHCIVTPAEPAITYDEAQALREWRSMWPGLACAYASINLDVNRQVVPGWQGE